MYVSVRVEVGSEVGEYRNNKTAHTTGTRTCYMDNEEYRGTDASV